MNKIISYAIWVVSLNLLQIPILAQSLNALNVSVSRSGGVSIGLHFDLLPSWMFAWVVMQWVLVVLIVFLIVIFTKFNGFTRRDVFLCKAQSEGWALTRSGIANWKSLSKTQRWITITPYVMILFGVYSFIEYLIVLTILSGADGEMIIELSAFAGLLIIQALFAFPMLAERSEYANFLAFLTLFVIVQLKIVDALSTSELIASFIGALFLIFQRRLVARYRANNV